MTYTTCQPTSNRAVGCVPDRDYSSVPLRDLEKRYQTPVGMSQSKAKQFSMGRHQRLRYGIANFENLFGTPAQRALKPSFSQTLFENPTSKAICEAVINTMFFKGMVQGTLDPEDYGGYMVQDAAYCFEAVKAFDSAAPKMQEAGQPDFALLYRSQSASYNSYNQDFVKKWKLKSADSVVLGPAAQMYVAFESALGDKDPRHLCIGILPCNMLWPWVAKELDPKVPDSSLYKPWFKANKSDHQSSAEQFVDKFFSKADLEECQPIFNEGMINELNFFLSACDQDLVDYDFGQVVPQ